MKAMRISAFVGFVLVSAQAGSFAQDMMPDSVKSSGGVLTNSKGMTLYTYDNDKVPGKSACNGQCLANWPAVAVTPDTMVMDDWSAVTRDDGSKQLAYKGKPLYIFAHDMKPGDKTGDGRGKVWHVAKP